MLRDSLQKYRAKRDFRITAEPAGKLKQGGRGRRYLIQKHAASRLHYDFRLEHNGVLLSWACPKGPSLNPADKRLAVHVEDHPVAYGDFEGTIPKGQYGGGTVMLWDSGTWEPQGDEDVDEALAKGKLAFVLHGERLKGKWALVHLRSRRPGDKGNNWLLIKEHDDEEREDGEALVEHALTSVKTGRRMEQIAQGGDVWRSNRDDDKPVKRSVTTATTKPSRRNASGAKKKSASGQGKIPSFVEPQLATLVDGPPPGGGWLHEIKYDGYRALASIGGGAVIIRTRRGLDWTDKFRSLVAPLAALPCEAALLDGEIAVADAQGHTNFSALQEALSSGSGRLGYYLFDLLHIDGKDLRALPLEQRKRRLETLLADVAKKGPLLYSGHVAGKGQEVFRQACALKLEGIVSKRADDRYRSGRTQSWLKSKCGEEQEFVIIGWEPSDKAGRPFSSILLAVRDEGELRYCGHVGSGFSGDRLDELAAEFRKHARRDSPVAKLPREAARHARYVEPVLVAEVAFRGWTADGLIRQGSFKGLRRDKPASAVVRERAMPTAKAATKAATKSSAKAAAKPVPESRNSTNAADEIAGVRVTHPDRMLFAEQGVTKRALAEYYERIADHMLPYIEGRPLALVRCPDGPGKECFFQKHASPGWPDVFGRIRIREKSRNDEYLYIDNVQGLVGAVQMGVLELHIWGSKAEDVEHPDRMVLDLDPDEDLDFSAVKDAARDVKKRLEAVGLQSFPMVTGGKGIHIVVPVAPRHSWDEHRGFAEAMARLMAEHAPNRYVANMAKAKRHGKIFIDYLRNQRGSTAIAPFSPRQRPGAFVALPVSWPQLARLDSAHPATITNAAKLASRRDPWTGYRELRQELPIKSRRGK